MSQTARRDKPAVVTSGLRIGGDVEPLISGEIHYFQHTPTDWPRLLDGLCELGAGALSTYVPWGRHEVEAGRYDFGERRPRLGLDRFLDLAAERGLRIVLRPGPHVNAELSWLGFPRRVLELEDVMARSPGGNPVWLPIAPRPFPIPSYASSRFLEEVERWLAAFAARVEPRAWPDGPVVAVQLDNEAPLVFRNGPFEQDYHEEALAVHREVAATRGRPVAEAPTRFDGRREEIPALFDWLDARVEVYARALRRMRRTMLDAGLDRVLFTHNLAQSGPIPDASPATFDAADLVGLDFYHLRQDLPLVIDRARWAVGSCEYPFVAELGIGGPWNLPARSPRDGLEQARTLLAAGFRGFNLFMVADRDRYYGAPFDERGRRHEQETVRGLRALIAAFRAAGLHELRLRAPVAIVVPRCYATLNIGAWTLGPLLPPTLAALGLPLDIGPLEDALGFDRPIQSAWVEDLGRLGAALDEAGIGYVLVESDVAAKRLERLDPAAVVVLAYELMDTSTITLLRNLAESRTPLFVGPKVPTLSRGLEPLEPKLEISREDVVDFGEADAVHALVAKLGALPGAAPRFRVAAPDVRVTELVDDAGATRVVGVVATGGERRRVHLDRGAGVEVRDLETGEHVTGELELAPFSARLLAADDGE